MLREFTDNVTEFMGLATDLQIKGLTSSEESDIEDSSCVSNTATNLEIEDLSGDIVDRNLDIQLSCNLCSYSNEIQSYMINHIGEKHVDRNMNCPLCKTKFSHKKEVMDHIQLIHGKM